MGKKHLSIDIGSSNAKAMLLELDGGGKLKMELVYRFPTPKTILNGYLCTDTFRIYEEICQALRLLGQRGVQVNTMGIDSWSSDFGFVNPDGIQIGMPAFYRDGRCKGMSERIAEKIRYERLYELTTQRKMIESALCQLLAVQEQQPHLLSEGNKLLFVADLLMQQFSGRICSEITLASYSQMFSMKKEAWEDEVFQLFGIPTSIQPEIVHPGCALGSISPRMAKWLGINQLEMIAPAGHDTSSAVAAVPAEPGKNWAFIATGSWFLVGMELDQVADPALSYRYTLSNTGLAFHKVMLKRNIMGMWLLQECKRCWDAMGLHLEYAEIAALAQQAEPFYAMLDTEDETFFNPEDMPQAIADYLHRTQQRAVEKTDVGRIARMIYESISMKCRYALEKVQEAAGMAVEQVYIIGGANRVGFLNDMIASACNMPLICGPTEASSLGNGLLQAYGSGELAGLEELRRTVRQNMEETTHWPTDHQAWDSRYTAFLELCGLKDE